MSIEAMKQALDYVETEITALAYLKEEVPQGLLDLQHTLKEALKQEQGKPVGEIVLWRGEKQVQWEQSLPVGTKFYTHPQPKREPLTDEKYFEIGQRHWLPSNKIEQIHKEILEAASGIKEGQ